MATTDPADRSSDAPDDSGAHDEDAKSPDSLPSGAGPQADEEQSDIASGGGSSS